MQQLQQTQRDQEHETGRRNSPSPETVTNPLPSDLVDGGIVPVVHEGLVANNPVAFVRGLKELIIDKAVRTLGGTEGDYHILDGYPPNELVTVQREEKDSKPQATFYVLDRDKFENQGDTKGSLLLLVEVFEKDGWLRPKIQAFKRIDDRSDKPAHSEMLQSAVIDSVDCYRQSAILSVVKEDASTYFNKLENSAIGKSFGLGLTGILTTAGGFLSTFSAVSALSSISAPDPVKYGILLIGALTTYFGARGLFSWTSRFASEQEMFEVAKGLSETRDTETLIALRDHKLTFEVYDHCWEQLSSANEVKIIAGIKALEQFARCELINVDPRCVAIENGYKKRNEGLPNGFLIDRHFFISIVKPLLSHREKKVREEAKRFLESPIFTP